jgi:ribosomal protein L7Ae-like RNA K-turn-binding protein
MNDTDKKIINLLSMAQKAGKLVSGEFAVEKYIQAGKAKLLLVAADASENAKKQYKDMSDTYGVQMYYVLTKNDLGATIGKNIRVAIALADNGFIKALLKLINRKAEI